MGLGEDGLAGLSDASRAALASAEVVFGAPRHLALAEVGPRGRAWPVPFDVAAVLALRGRRVVVLASGDPFWFGAGAVLAGHLEAGEWLAHPAPSTFSLVASRLGWRLEDLACLALHAAPFAQALAHMHRGARLACLLRGGPSAAEFARWLDTQGFGASALWVMEALGGPRERIRRTTAAAFNLAEVAAPVAVAVELAGTAGLPRSAGLPDAGYAHDGQITKAAVRALTLSALAPRPGEHLWDVGAGSGSVAVEWCLAGGSATAIERQAARAANARANAQRFGVAARLSVVEGAAPGVLGALPRPAAIFVGGGFDAALFDALRTQAPGCRLVVNAVTLDTEAALLALHARHGGELVRVELARAAPLGSLRGWAPARPVVQWSATLPPTMESTNP